MVSLPLSASCHPTHAQATSHDMCSNSSRSKAGVPSPRLAGVVVEVDAEVDAELEPELNAELEEVV